MNIKQLAEGIGLEQDEYMELLELFIDRGMSDLDRLETAARDEDAEGAVHAAHSIKGAAGNLGLTAFYERFKKIEEDARKGRIGGIMESSQRLRKELDQMAAIVHTQSL